MMRRKIFIGAAISLFLIVATAFFVFIPSRVLQEKVEYEPIRSTNVIAGWLDNEIELFLVSMFMEGRTVYIFQAGVEFAGKRYTAFFTSNR